MSDLRDVALVALWRQIEAYVDATGGQSRADDEQAAVLASLGALDERLSPRSGSFVTMLAEHEAAIYVARAELLAAVSAIDDEVEAGALTNARRLLADLRARVARRSAGGEPCDHQLTWPEAGYLSQHGELLCPRCSAVVESLQIADVPLVVSKPGYTARIRLPGGDDQ